MPSRRRFSFLLSLFAVLAIGAALSSPAGATVVRNGTGLSIAHDEYSMKLLPPCSDPMPALGEGFKRLNPKVFRLMTPWNTMDHSYPAGNEQAKANAKMREVWTCRTEQMIARARSLGVQKILLTIKGNDAENVQTAANGEKTYHPSPVLYEYWVRRLVEKFGPQVDVWGPANEPNHGWAPKGISPRDIPAATLAEYFAGFKEVVTVWDSTAEFTSPDFHDKRYGTTDWNYMVDYITKYKQVFINRGEPTAGFGHYAAWHPYYGVESKTLTSTNKYAELIPAGKNIWVTEVGAKLTEPGQTLQTQNEQAGWMINSLGGHARVVRISYYNMRQSYDDGNPATPYWDSGLLTREDLAPRPAWKTWCVAAHNNDANHADCNGYVGIVPPPPPVPPSLGSSAYSAGGEHYAFYRGSDKAIWLWAWYGNAWHQERAGGTSEVGEPTAYAANGYHNVYFRGEDKAIWQLQRSNSSRSWVLTRLGGTALSDPVAYSQNGEHFVYFRGIEGAIWQWYWSAGSGWSYGRIGPNALGLSSEPVGTPTAYPEPNAHHVYYRGKDNAIYQWSAYANAWHQSRLGGTALGNPDSYYQNGEHFLYARGAEGAIWQWYWNAGSGWSYGRIGPNATGLSSEPIGTPTAYFDPAGAHDVYYRGKDNAIYQWSAYGNAWHQSRLGGSALEDPEGYPTNNEHFVYYRNSEDRIAQLYWSGGTWYSGVLTP
jgi:hypothetical protein